MKLVLALCLTCLLVMPAYALLDDIDQQKQGQIGINEQDQAQGQAQGQLQGQAQGQAQGQIATGGDAFQGQGQAMGQGQIGSVSTIITEEDSDEAPDSIAFPSVVAAEGTSSATASYMFGNLGLADTETYKKGSHMIQTILAIPDDILSKAEKAELVTSIVEKMNESVRPRRLFGVGPEQHSKNLLNMFGLLSWDSWWADGQQPFQKKDDM